MYQRFQFDAVSFNVFNAQEHVNMIKSLKYSELCVENAFLKENELWLSLYSF